MRRAIRSWIAAAILVTLTIAGVGCASSPAEDEGDPMQQVIAAVSTADPRAETVEAKASVSGLSHGWDVTYVVPAGETVDADELAAVLRAVRNDGGKKAGHVKLIVKDAAGADVDLSSAADELGISWMPFFSGISVSGSAIDTTLGGGS